MKHPWNFLETPLKLQTPLKLSWNTIQNSLGLDKTPRTLKDKKGTDERTEWQCHFLSCSLQLNKIKLYTNLKQCWSKTIGVKKISLVQKEFWVPKNFVQKQILMKMFRFTKKMGFGLAYFILSNNKLRLKLCQAQV